MKHRKSMADLLVAICEAHTEVGAPGTAAGATESTSESYLGSEKAAKPHPVERQPAKARRFYFAYSLYPMSSLALLMYLLSQVIVDTAGTAILIVLPL